MNRLPLLFLDFDGVICDSLDECIASSLYAYFNLLLNKGITSLPIDYKKRFALLRPYVRNGEDYLVIQQILKDNIHIKDQIHFDDILLKYRDKMAFYKELFYKARSLFIEKDPGFWFSLNRIYPHILHSLSKASASPYCFILSTKRSDFIHTILKQNRISMPEDHILVAWNIKKLDLISSLLDKGNYPAALFVDDQIDHLKKNNDVRITTYLAKWGYIQKEWLDREVKTIDEEEMAEIMMRY
ncbi:MAG: HAD family hydrolase [Spirochaetales bacterium]|nr:HAD family hydrolase [Spirochaetales bacterium]